MDKITKIEKAIADQENPMTYKKQLAYEIVKMLNDEKAAGAAQEAFEKNVQRGEMPDEITEVILSDDDDERIDEDLLVTLNLASSKSEAKRLIEQGGVEVDGKKLTKDDGSIQVKDGMILKVGKRKIVRLRKPR
jgi:tyrosyl-tRNA synthetase